jgi:outer membrane protein assembly factor BamB
MYRQMAIAADLVVVCSGRYAFAIDAASGMTRWAYGLNASPCRAVVASDKVYVASDRELAALAYATGKPIFHVQTELFPDVTLVVDGERIYVGARGKVACFDQVGQKLWGNDLGTGSGVGFAVPGLAPQIDRT